MEQSGISISQIGLAVLAGGRGTRMGQPKGLLKIDGKPILEYLLERMNWPGPKWLITAPGVEHPPAWRSFDQEWVDAVAGQGPLRGVLTALEHATTPMVVVATVDMLGITREQIEWVANQLANSSCHGLICRRSAQTGICIEPFPLGVRRDARTFLARRIGEGLLSVGSLTDAPEFAAIDAPAHWPERIWTNLNRPEDLSNFVADAHRV